MKICDICNSGEGVKTINEDYELCSDCEKLYQKYGCMNIRNLIVKSAKLEMAVRFLIQQVEISKFKEGGLFLTKNILYLRLKEAVK